MSNNMMRAMAIQNGFGKDLSIIESPIPTPKGEEILVKTTFSGVCHSDLHLWEGFFDMGNGNLRKIDRPFPIVPGHEFEGEIVAMGPDVPASANLKMGVSYAIFPWLGCAESSCPHCGNGDTYNLCERPNTQKWIDGRDYTKGGGYSSHQLVPSYRYLINYTGALPKGLGCIYMCSGLTAYSALSKCKLDDRHKPIHVEDLLILGLGGLGFQAMGFAEAMHGKGFLCADIDESKLEYAAKTYSCKTYNAAKDGEIERLRAESRGGGGINTVIDFVGSEKSFAFGSSCLRKGGRVIVVGLLGGAMASPIPAFPMSQRTVRGSFVGSLGETNEMMELLRSNGGITVPPHTFKSIHEASKCLRDLQKSGILGRQIMRHDWDGKM